MNLLFDLDGTLTDPFDGITRSIIYALDCLGYPAPAPETLGWCIGPSLRASFARVLDTNDTALVETALAKYRERFGTIGLFENTVYEGIPEVLQGLATLGHTLYVATAKPAVYAQQIIGHFGLQDHFRKVYGSELDGTRGNKADLIAHIMETEALCPTETLMIGDHAQDMVGAGQNGLPAIGVLWGYGAREDLLKAGAIRIVAAPADLAQVISGNFNEAEISRKGNGLC
jgi:phosphoglycolate phosphatase